MPIMGMFRAIRIVSAGYRAIKQKVSDCVCVCVCLVAESIGLASSFEQIATHLDTLLYVGHSHLLSPNALDLD